MPLVTLILVILNLAAFCLELVDGPVVCERFGLVPALFMKTGSIEPIFTSMFLHDPRDLFHLGGNMAFLLIFGIVVERALGSFRFLSLYALAGLAGALLHVAVDPGSTAALVGASGAIFGVLGVAAVLHPRLLGFVASFAAIEIWHALAGGGGSVSFGCHLGGLFAGFVFAALLKASGDEAFEAA